MTLHFDLQVNGETIGCFEAINRVYNSGTPSTYEINIYDLVPDDEPPYAVRRVTRHQFGVEHNRADGAWELICKALNQLDGKRPKKNRTPQSLGKAYGRASEQIHRLRGEIALLRRNHTTVIVAENERLIAENEKLRRELVAAQEARSYHYRASVRLRDELDAKAKES